MEDNNVNSIKEVLAGIDGKVNLIHIQMANLKENFHEKINDIIKRLETIEQKVAVHDADLNQSKGSKATLILLITYFVGSLSTIFGLLVYITKH